MAFNRKTKVIISTFILITATTITSLAHSGRTDSSGGHRDNKNKSGLGSYHYHCGGYSAHLHKNGVCPYGKTNSSNNISSSSGGSSSGSSHTSKPSKTYLKELAYKKGYDIGYKDGFNKEEFDFSDIDDIDYEDDFSEGYSKGYSKGQDDINRKKEEYYNLGYDNGLTGETRKEIKQNDILIDEYDRGYEDGNNIYIENLKEKYASMGAEDAKAFKECRDFEFGLNDKLINAYNNSYYTIIATLESDTKEKGYTFALQGKPYVEQNYEDNFREKWFLYGYEDGVKDIEAQKQLAYNKGYNDESYSVPKKFNSISNIITSEYNKGLELRKGEDTQKRLMGVGMIVGTGGIYSIYNKRNKYKK